MALVILFFSSSDEPTRSSPEPLAGVPCVPPQSLWRLASGEIPDVQATDDAVVSTIKASVMVFIMRHHK
jgi:hypothetical protein